MTYHCVCCAVSGEQWTKYNTTFLYLGTTLCHVCVRNACNHKQKFGPGETLPTTPLVDKVKNQ